MEEISKSKQESRGPYRVAQFFNEILCFAGPFTQPVSSVMYLTNPSDRKVCFKIKTTAPKKYCVKPNSGVIDPDEKVKISGIHNKKS